MKIELKNNKGFSWHQNKSIFIKGYFYDENNVFYQKENAIKFLSSIENKEDFKSLLKILNGVFSIIVLIDNLTFIAADTTRSFPIFYTLKNEEIILSDDILHLKNNYGLTSFNTVSETELKSSYHTHGKKTLLKNVFQVQSNQYLIIKKNTIIENNFFFSYAIKEENSGTYNSLKNNAVKAFENTFKRLIKSLDNKTVVIPLSAGFDSRLISVFLKKYNYKNVICYTYGRKDSFEIENSKKTAENLGFQWHFIEYNNDLIGDFVNTKEFESYAHFAGKHIAMPNMQEFFAVRYLKESQIIPKDSIFISGYAGDLLGGSQFLKVIPESLNHSEIVDLILSKKFNMCSLSNSNKKKIEKEIKNSLLNFDENYLEKIPSSVFEDYDIKEKIAKYIFNSASFYTFFGFEHRFPFWDKELLNFFKQVPVKFKVMKTLFDDVLINNYFKPENVYFKSENQPSKKIIYTQKIKDKVKPILPTFIKEKFLQKNDWNNYESITKRMLFSLKKENIENDRKFLSYNEIIIQWYLIFCKNSAK